MLGRKTGFSMVEVIVVLVIIATISAGGMLIAGRNTDRAKFVRAQKDLDTIQQGFMQYYNVAGDYNEVKTGDNDLDAAVTDTQLPRLSDTKANDVLQSFYGKNLNEWLDPWNNKYRIFSSHETTGKGMIIVYVDPDKHTNIITGPVDEISETPKDVYTHPDGVAMYRIIYNVKY